MLVNPQNPCEISSFSSYQQQRLDPIPKLAQDLIRKEFPLNGNLRALSVVSQDIVWVSGSEGSVFRTVNGGLFWQACPINDSKADFRSFHAFNSLEACAASAGHSDKGEALVYRTQDGGETWQKVLEISEPGFFISGMAFWDSDHGILLCDPVDGIFRFFITKDGGHTWQLMDGNSQLQSLQGESLFAASNTCMALHGSEVWFATGGGETARVFHSKDCGRCWDVYETPFKCSGKLSGIFSLAFRTPLEGIAVGGNYQNPRDFSSSNIIITQDGGKSWQPFHDDRFAGLCLFCVAWDKDQQPVIVEGSSKTFHTVVSFQNQLWLAGPDKIALITNYS